MSKASDRQKLFRVLKRGNYSCSTEFLIVLDKLFRDAAIEINTDGKIVNISGKPLEGMLIPCDLLDITVTACASTEILDAIKKPINGLIWRTESEECILQTLTQAGLFPTPESEKFTGSIAQLKEKIKTIPYVGKECHICRMKAAILAFETS
ncbi:hypothetical protein F5B22DRAFT_641880 [Xylaria bambusicola]|uniref:uncharacterized protein n=1 Tax=Xylaria bambusicola TaxID=326684 RepID=UPI0020080C30|nr:uncharacterized protein F5B22DRAFT_641880 [Xylaria bambusicola]KAI0526737.1 hypothetical protein F5B22DRAFT_641880 [Xylaria bambusicola]